MHIHCHRILASLTIVAVLLALVPGPVVAQSSTVEPITLIDQWTNSDFPSLFSFHVHARSSKSAIVSATLLVRYPGYTIYDVYPARDFSRRPEIATQVVWNLQHTTNPPWQLMMYHWRLRDDAGHVLVTPEASSEFEDQTHPWQKQTFQKLTLYYYDQSDKIVKKLFSAAQLGYQSLIKATGHTPQSEIRVVVYNDQHEFCSFHAPGTCKQAEAGVAITATALMWIEPDWQDPGQQWLLRHVVPHELAHAFLSEWLGQRIGGVPDWFNEGQAMNAELEGLNDNLRMARSLALNSQLFPLYAMYDETKMPKNALQVAQWYAQATSLVAFLYERWGVESLGKLMNEVYNYIPFELALDDVTGLRIEQFEYEWRLWLKAPKSSH